MASKVEEEEKKTREREAEMRERERVQKRGREFCVGGRTHEEEKKKGNLELLGLSKMTLFLCNRKTTRLLKTDDMSFDHMRER